MSINLKKIKLLGKKKRDEKGITMIALVVTIIVLLILAGITIGAITGDDGTINEAQRAKNDADVYAIKQEIGTAILQVEQERSTPTIDDVINKLIKFDIIENEIDVNKKTGAITTKKGYLIEDMLNDYKNKPETVADMIGQEAFNKNMDITDEFQNKITIPAGFTIVANGTESEIISKVEYSKDIPTVMDGIVIQDSEGNQFVWVPVGDIKTDSNGTTKTINLSRYEFADGTSNYTDKDGKTYTAPAKGTPIDKGDTAIIVATFTYKENATEGTNTHALSLTNFKTNSKNKGGYYIARYEASYGTDGKANSKKSVGKPALTNPSTYTEGQLWNFITQPDAAIASQNMYKENPNYTSDLINSYAWDTAIVFIQTFSTGNSEYSKKLGTSINSQLANTGINNDGPLNIYDMAGNVKEWSTETYNGPGGPCTFRGGRYNYGVLYTSTRTASNTTSIYLEAFRPLLYL